ncbi:MAG: SDR family NAD(P)-dependent oxidoreductase [Sphingobacteriales bacterium JAD_PAG50586_3]|nr:MAG: SDR family NAD(P)-dependent oxidoreductase [Sphingobacteriales bacterium JAD_PAG50586_3]
MKIYYITGTSRGIGKALAEHILSLPDTKVIGLARHQTIQHANYKHVDIDLSNTSFTANFYFEQHAEATEIVLVNNSGVIGDIARFGSINNDKIVEAMHVNLIAPFILSNNFVKAYQGLTIPLTILNISSGAARNPVDAWGAYCTSKAGVDMFSKVLSLEQEIVGRKNLRCLSLAPGIIDTQMQDAIRATNPADFSRHADFVAFKEEGKLVTPVNLAPMIVKALAKQDYDSVTIDLRELSS